jgi:hypothetical protein
MERLAKSDVILKEAVESRSHLTFDGDEEVV